MVKKKKWGVSELYNLWVKKCILPRFLGLKEKKLTGVIIPKNDFRKNKIPVAPAPAETLITKEAIKPNESAEHVDTLADGKSQTDDRARKIIIPLAGVLNVMNKSEIISFTEKNDIDIPDNITKKKLIILLNEIR